MVDEHASDNGLSRGSNDLRSRLATERFFVRPPLTPTEFEINQTLQKAMRERCVQSITAVEAASILDNAGVLFDSPERPGRELRRLLREGKIIGSRQEPNRRWFVDRVD